MTHGNEQSPTGGDGGRQTADNAGTARQLAFTIIREHTESGRFVSRLRDPHFDRSSLSPGDRRLATEISTGIIRRRATLNCLLRRYVSRPRKQVETDLWLLLQLGAYQLVFLEGIPPHAAVSETVNLAKQVGQPRWSGFLNGVLRALSRDITPDVTESPAGDAVPLTAGRYRRLRKSVFPNPETQPARYFAQAFSFPDWPADRWLPRFGCDELFRIGFWFNERHGLTLRVNRLRTSRDDVLRVLREAGIEAHPGTLDAAVVLSRSARVEELPGFRDGWWTVQDESAIQAGELLAPQPGDTVLDLCAAPGTKATHLAERMQNTGRVLATDVNDERLGRITDNARRLGLTIIEPKLIRPDLSDLPRETFDAVLVDVPCSNTGVLGKRPEARWRLQPDDLQELSGQQMRLLRAACACLKPGGRLVYSTCSIEPEENEGVVTAVLQNRSDLQLEHSQLVLPGRPSDGGFLTRLRVRLK